MTDSVYLKQTQFTVDVTLDVQKSSTGAIVRNNTQTISVTLTATSVPVETVFNALLSSNSRKVAWQASWRKNGVPTGRAIVMSWSEWLGTPKTRSVEPMTAEQVAARMSNDPAFAEQMRKLLGIVDGAASE